MGDGHLPCPAFLFASMLILYHSYHVFLALTSLFLIKIISAGKQISPSVTLRVPAPLSGEPFLDVAPPKHLLKGEGDRLRWRGSLLPAFSFVFLAEVISI